MKENFINKKKYHPYDSTNYFLYFLICFSLQFNIQKLHEIFQILKTLICLILIFSKISERKSFSKTTPRRTIFAEAQPEVWSTRQPRIQQVPCVRTRENRCYVLNISARPIKFVESARSSVPNLCKGRRFDLSRWGQAHRERQ